MGTAARTIEGALDLLRLQPARPVDPVDVRLPDRHRAHRTPTSCPTPFESPQLQINPFSKRCSTSLSGNRPAPRHRRVPFFRRRSCLGMSPASVPVPVTSASSPRLFRPPSSVPHGSASMLHRVAMAIGVPTPLSSPLPFSRACATRAWGPPCFARSSPRPRACSPRSLSASLWQTLHSGCINGSASASSTMTVILPSWCFPSTPAHPAMPDPAMQRTRHARC